MTPPHNNFGDSQRELHASPVRLSLHDVWTEMHKLDSAKIDRLDRIEKKLDDVLTFKDGETAKGSDGAMSRLNAHSTDIGEIKDKVKWVERGVLAGLIGLLITITGGLAAWGLTRVAEKQDTSARSAGGH